MSDKFAVALIFLPLYVLFCVQMPSAQEWDTEDRWVKYCNKLYDDNILAGLAGLRKCILDHRNIELSSLKKSKACNNKYCIYKLQYSRKIQRDEYWFTYIYEGSGYSFYYLDDIEVSLVKHDQSEHPARLIDSNGRQTIVSQCTGSSCGHYFEYDHGPLRGAELRGLYGGSNYEDSYWVLKLPR